MEGIVLEAEQNLQTSLKSGDYQYCYTFLENMKSESNVNRIALNANVALVDFALSGWTAVEKYKETISKLKEQAKSEGDPDRPILSYNDAVIAFHARRWSLALQSLQQLISSNVSTSIRIDASLLLAETYLKLCDPERAISTLATIENAFGTASKDVVTEAQKHRLFVTKVRSCLMMRNVRRCKKEIKSMPSDISPHPSSIAVFKAHQEYLRENYRKSLRLIMVATESASSEQQNPATGGDCFKAIFNNALGCNYARMGKFHLAASYFEKAVDEYQKIRVAWLASVTQKGHQSLPIYAGHLSSYWSMLHNYALALLQAGFPERAFDYFIQIVKVYPKNARLWLRLAECCILARQKNNEAEFSLERRRHECVRDVVGVGPHRKIVLNSNLSNRKRGSFDESAVPSLTYEFAHLCLKNALLMLPAVKQDQLRMITVSPTNSSSSSEREIVLLWPSSPHSPVGGKEVYRLKCSILCAMSFIRLSVHEHALSLESAKTLLAMEHVSPLHKLLSRFYAAESLVFLNRLEDAANHLSLDPVSDLTVSELAAQAQGLPPPNWYPKSVKSATLTLLHNAGVVCILMGESAKASEITKLVRAGIGNGGECPVLAITQTLYQLLQREQVENAKTILCRFYPYLQIGEHQTVS